MSAVTPIADKRRCNWIVRFVPEADSCSAAKNGLLFYHLVGAGEQREEEIRGPGGR
jgi:hypothetical protein